MFPLKQTVESLKVRGDYSKGVAKVNKNSISATEIFQSQVE